MKLNKKQQLLLEEFARASEEENVPMVKRFVSKLHEIQSSDSGEFAPAARF